MQQTKDQVTKEIVRYRESLTLFESELDSLQELFESVPDLLYAYFYPHEAKIIAAVRTRAAFAPIRALHTGKWDKAVSHMDEGFRYSAISDKGINLIIYVSELPPSCKIIEEQVPVPACEAGFKTVRRIVCPATKKEEVADSQ